MNKYTARARVNPSRRAPPTAPSPRRRGIEIYVDLYVCIYIYICMCIYMYVYVSTCVCVYFCISVCIFYMYSFIYRCV